MMPMFIGMGDSRARHGLAQKVVVMPDEAGPARVQIIAGSDGPAAAVENRHDPDNRGGCRHREKRLKAGVINRIVRIDPGLEADVILGQIEIPLERSVEMALRKRRRDLVPNPVQPSESRLVMALPNAARNTSRSSMSIARIAVLPWGCSYPGAVSS
jgi:hypothetical protein